MQSECNHHAISMQSACTQHALSMHSACNQHALSMHSACTQHALSMHSACNQHAISMQSACNQHAISMHSACTQRALSMHSACTQNALSRHSAGTQHACASTPWHPSHLRSILYTSSATVQSERSLYNCSTPPVREASERRQSACIRKVPSACNQRAISMQSPAARRRYVRRANGSPQAPSQAPS